MMALTMGTIPVACSMLPSGEQFEVLGYTLYKFGCTSDSHLGRYIGVIGESICQVTPQKIARKAIFDFL
jgi:hypothetical protein